MDSLVDKPLPPKKPLTAYLIFRADIFLRIKKLNPKKKMTEI